MELEGNHLANPFGKTSSITVQQEINKQNKRQTNKQQTSEQPINKQQEKQNKQQKQHESQKIIEKVSKIAPHPLMGGPVRNDVKLSATLHPLMGGHVRNDVKLSIGGDFTDCLNAEDINSALKDLPITEDFRALDAFHFFNYRTGTLSATAFNDLLNTALTQYKFVVVPAHVRHHWLTLFFIARGQQQTPECVIYDSCMSRQITRDISRLIHALPDYATIHISVATCYQQRRDSMECGLFVIYFSLQLYLKARKHTPPPKIGSGHFSLAEWRLPLAQSRNIFALLRKDLETSEGSESTSRKLRHTEGGHPQQLPQHSISAEGDFLEDEDAKMSRCVTMIQRSADRLESEAAKLCLCYALTGMALEAILHLNTGLLTMESVRKAARERDIALPGREGCVIEFCSSMGQVEMVDEWKEGFPVSTAKMSAHQDPAGDTTRIIVHANYALPTSWVSRNEEGTFKYDALAYAVFKGKESKTDCGSYAYTGHWKLVPVGERDRWGIPRVGVFTRARYIRDPFIREDWRDVDWPSIGFPANFRTELASDNKKHPHPPTRHDPYSALVFESAQETQSRGAQPPTRVIELPNSPPGPEKTVRLTHGAVRRLVATLSLGTHFETSWSSNGESGTWLGVIARQSYPGIPTQAQYSCEYCNRCAAWHAFEDASALWDVPARGVSYYTFQAVESPPIATSKCEDLDNGSEDSTLSTSLNSSSFSDLTNDKPNKTQPETPVPAEFEPLTVHHYVPCSQLRGDAICRHYIFQDKPPHIHTVSWNRVSHHTHRSRIRWLNVLRAIEQPLHRVPFDSAVLETVTSLAKKRRWKPSTFSKALSDVAAACRSLTLYTNASSSIDLESSVLFTEAMRRARSLAESTIPREIRPLLDYAPLLPLFTTPYPRALFCLCWHSAARVGDARQLRKEDIEFLAPDSTGTAPVNVRLTFRRGKGFAFWGLYTIVCKIPRQEAQKISSCMDSRPPNENIFSTEDQKCLTKVLKSKGFEARSIRKGKLISLARAGCSDADIMALSGHKKLSTLRKYIGNEGLNDAAAAERRATQETVEPPLQSSLHMMNEEHTGGDFQPVMGTFANVPQHQGQRFLPPPRFFPEKAPSEEELGLPAAQLEGQVSKEGSIPAELHVKTIVPLTANALNRIPQLCSNTTITTAYHHFMRYLNDPTIYPVCTPPLRTIPISRSFSNADLDQLVSLRKIEIFSGTPRGFVNAFTVPHKGKRRPIFEPSSNAAFKSMESFKLHYPSRLSRRVVHSHAALFDFATYYDQFELHPSVRDQYVFRAMHHGSLKTFALTRLPMGASPSAALAQLTTWCVTHDLTKQGKVMCHTMIDNVRFAGTRAQVMAAAQSFTLICKNVGLQFNEVESGFYGVGIGPSQYVFLGEHFDLDPPHPTVRNTEKNLAKTTNGIRVLSERKGYTYRNFAALVGLLFFMAHTVGYNLSKVFNLLRTYRAIFSAVTTGTAVSWDDELQFISPMAMQDISALHHAIQDSVPLYQPMSAKTKPLTTIFVDSCSTGWGAVIDSEDSQTTVAQSFSPTEYSVTRFSANSEPLGIYNLLQFLLANKKLQGRVVVFTDHEAVVSGAFEPTTGFKGFSRNFYLNRLYLLVQEIQTRAEVTFEYIKGVENPADVVSRTTKSRMIVCEASNLKIPAIRLVEKSFPEGGDFSQHHTPITNETGVHKANQRSKANGQ